MLNYQRVNQTQKPSLGVFWSLLTSTCQDCQDLGLDPGTQGTSGWNQGTLIWQCCSFFLWPSNSIQRWLILFWAMADMADCWHFLHVAWLLASRRSIPGSHAPHNASLYFFGGQTMAKFRASLEVFEELKPVKQPLGPAAGATSLGDFCRSFEAFSHLFSMWTSSTPQDPGQKRYRYSLGPVVQLCPIFKVPIFGLPNPSISRWLIHSWATGITLDCYGSHEQLWRWLIYCMNQMCRFTPLESHCCSSQKSRIADPPILENRWAMLDPLYQSLDILGGHQSYMIDAVGPKNPRDLSRAAIS